ncbi:MAG: NACHT domain-containing protein [Promethearchaeota archaeon]
MRDFGWERYWVREGNEYFLDWAGYLVDPALDFSPNSGLEADLTNLSENCVILLGEPGMGKTTELEGYRQELEERSNEDGGAVVYVDLSHVGTDVSFKAEVFENSRFAGFVRGEHTLHLLLDSFDECLLRVDVVANLLVDQLSRCPINRLFLRVASRTGHWPRSLEERLRDLWGKGRVGRYTLTPLRRKDVEAAVEAELAGVGEKCLGHFLEEIEELGVVPFAVRPITLVALLDGYKRSGVLPSTKTDVYRSFCLRLCGEVNAARNDTGPTREYTPEQRYAIAQRCAATCLVSNNHGIWTGTEGGSVPSGYVPESILRGGREGATGQTFDVIANSLRETLACGLFTGTDPRREWAHRSFAEFLAAEYLNQKGASPVQVLSLVTNYADPEGRVVPQLRGVVAWLCSMDDSLVDEVLERDPEVLVHSDPSFLTDLVKERVTTYLLTNYPNSPLRLEYIWTPPIPKGLTHPRLEGQVRDFLSREGNPRESILFALELVKRCDLRGLTPDLIDLVLNEDIDGNTRIKAALTLNALTHGRETVLARVERFKHLALDGDQKGGSLDLKGACLKILWPDHISASELFDHLIPPNKIGGVYCTFIGWNLVENLPNSGIGRALQWVRENLETITKTYLFIHLADRILAKALKCTRDGEIFEALAQTICAMIGELRLSSGKWENHQEFQSLLEGDQALRRELLLAVIELLPNEPKELNRLVSFASSCGYKLASYQRDYFFTLISFDDLEWIVDQLRNTPDTGVREKLAHIIRRIFPREEEYMELAYELYREVPILESYFVNWFGPVEIESDLAMGMEKFYQERGDFEPDGQDSGDAPSGPVKPTFEEDVNSLLENCEEGQVGGWVQVYWRMVPRSGPFISNLTRTQTWRSVPEDTRARIVSAAKRYLTEASSEMGGGCVSPRDGGVFNVLHAGLAGYAALRLLLELDPNTLENLPADAWGRLTPSILTFPVDRTLWEEEEEKRDQLLRLAYSRSRDGFFFALSDAIDQGTLDVGIPDIWDEQFGLFLHVKALEDHLDLATREEILEVLLRHDYCLSTKLAFSLITSRDSTTAGNPPLSLRAASALMINSASGGWDAIWPRIRDEMDWGRELFERVAERVTERKHQENRIFSKYTVHQLADLYIWLVDQYPLENASRQDEPVISWRDDILDLLRGRGTFESCEAIRRVMRDRPSVEERARWALVGALELARKEWPAPTPREVLELLRNPQSRLVKSGVQLLEVLGESLDRLTDKLQGRNGHHPMARYLWDHRGGGAFRPVYEVEFSDFVKDHLLDDLPRVLVHREVEIRPGSSPDITVTVSEPSDGRGYRGALTATVEVKCSWHSELKTAMRDQLSDQYLGPTSLKYGLYLVGWFRSSYWDKSDDRKGNNASNFPAIEDLTRFLEEQARELSTGGTTVKSKVVDASLVALHEILYSRARGES